MPIPSAKRWRVRSEGLALPFSSLLVSACAMPVFSANCFCVRPDAVRASIMTWMMKQAHHAPARLPDHEHDRAQGGHPGAHRLPYPAQNLWVSLLQDDGRRGILAAHLMPQLAPGNAAVYRRSAGGNRRKPDEVQAGGEARRVRIMSANSDVMSFM